MDFEQAAAARMPKNRRPKRSRRPGPRPGIRLADGAVDGIHPTGVEAVPVRSPLAHGMSAQGWKTEDRRGKTEDRGQKTDGQRQPPGCAAPVERQRPRRFASAAPTAQFRVQPQAARRIQPSPKAVSHYACHRTPKLAPVLRAHFSDP